MQCLTATWRRSRNQRKRKGGPSPRKKWKRSPQVSPLSPNPRNKPPQKRTTRQTSPGACPCDITASRASFPCLIAFILLPSVPWSCPMLPPWKTNNARALHPKLSTLSPASQRRGPFRNRDVSVPQPPKRHSGSSPRRQTGLWHVWSDRRRKAGRFPPLALSQAVVQQLGARTGPQQRFWGGKGVRPSRVGRAAFQERPP